ncbi:hypothetical protein GGR95_002621 [Sulfitobacter undariae]|uniref:DUF4132 domain-containing protein n=1 Tax=Sulfitobacter undariae TaxID=1563671 RepID=A0A7W6E580_9RHOB|nr:DUF4132 domain-containing protein [Sulfitobacter undariae]MBB3994971.1 hypothetical protein [Sulfitobacter undariae]
MTDSGKSGGWIKRLMGKASSVMGSPAHPELTKHFSWLDQVEKGLTAKVVSFILTQENATVIASLEALSAQISQARPELGYDSRKIESWSYFKPNFIINQANDLGQRERFIRIITLTDFAHTSFHEISSDAVGNDVQSLLHCFSDFSYGINNTSARFSLDDLVALICKLGGRPADLIDHITLGNYSNLPKHFGTGDALEKVHEYVYNLDAPEVIEGIKRQSNNDRVAAVKALTWRKIASRPAYLDFLLEIFTTGATSLRDASRAALLTHDHDIVTQKVIPLVSAGKIAVRTAAIQILGDIGTKPALDALQERREVEKTQNLQMLLDQIIGSDGNSEEAKVDGGYKAVNDTVITLPDRIILSQEAGAPFDKDDLATLQEIDARLEKSALERFEIGKANGYKPKRPQKVTTGADIFALFTGKKELRTRHNRSEHDQTKFVTLAYIPQSYHAWIIQAFGRLPVAQALDLSVAATGSLYFLTSQWYRDDPTSEWILEALRAGKFDLRDVLETAEKHKLSIRHTFHDNESENASPGDFTRSWMVSTTQHGISAAASLSESYEPETYWPLIAEHLDVIADALPPTTLAAQQNSGALALIGLLPALPAHLVPQILFVAIGESRTARERARALLADVPDLDDTIATTLTDKRQAVRANAAAFLAQRGAKATLPQLIKRLKVEKSETARAAMISAVADLGGDTGPYLSQKALVAEAEKLVAKLSADKIDWLPVDQAPALHWKDGKKVEPVILDAWLRLAVKIKSLEDGALFDLYLSQIKPEDAEKLAVWVLTSWIGYDTQRPSKSELIAEVTPTAQQYKSQYTHYKDTPLDEIVAMLIRYRMQSYPNSGSASKGILALTYSATPSLMARVIAAYLKEHGKRVAQAKTLVEVLAGAGTPEAIQVLVATSTRFKQRSVREFAETCVTRLAEERGWTADELADRSIPSGGLEEGGVMELEVGEELKTYTVRLAPDMTVRIVSPTGKEVKSLPAGTDAATKEAKALLSALKKTVKTVTAQQQTRLYEAMMAERIWKRDDWQSDLNAHPIMSRLTDRVVWRALAEDHTTLTTFRPTPEGDLFDVEGDDADISAAKYIDIAHSATMPAAQRESWQTHMTDFEITPLFAQFSRPVLELTATQRGETKITDREGWLMEALKLRSATSKLGYDRGPVEDGAGFSEYSKTFRSAGLNATLHFTGSYVPEDNIPVAIMHMTFNKGHRSLKLGDVPPLLLSECWNDMHDIAKSGAFDPEWQKKGLY